MLVFLIKNQNHGRYGICTYYLDRKQATKKWLLLAAAATDELAETE